MYLYVSCLSRHVFVCPVYPIIYSSVLSIRSSIRLSCLSRHGHSLFSPQILNYFYSLNVHFCCHEKSFWINWNLWLPWLAGSNNFGGRTFPIRAVQVCIEISADYTPLPDLPTHFSSSRQVPTSADTRLVSAHLIRTKTFDECMLPH